MSDLSKHPARDTPGVTALRADLGAVLAESQALRADVQTAEAARKRATQVNIAMLGLLALFTGLLVAIGWQGSQVIHRVDETNAHVASCTTPGGDCYEQGRKRGDEAISAVVRISIFVSQCGRLWPGESGPDYDRKLEQCVMERLQASIGGQTARPGPSAPGGGTPAPSPSG